MAEKKFTDKLDRLSYALGLTTANYFLRSGVKSFNQEVFLKAIKDVYTGEVPGMKPEEANQVLEKFKEEANARLAETNLFESLDFLNRNGNDEDIELVDFGLQYKVLKRGRGPIPRLTDKVKFHYNGRFIDGTIFDSSLERGEPVVYPVNGLIKGMAKALQLMPVGSKWRLFIPPDLAYGRQGAGNIIGPNLTLIFDLELLEIVKIKIEV